MYVACAIGKVSKMTKEENGPTAKKPNPRCLDSGASCTIFQEPSDVLPGRFKKGSAGSVQLAVGSHSTRCIGSVTIRVGTIDLRDSIHAEVLHGTLVSVDQICGKGKTVVFLKSEALTLDTDNVELTENIISL